MSEIVARKLPEDRCDYCDNGIENEWEFCPYCGCAHGSETTGHIVSLTSRNRELAAENTRLRAALAQSDQPRAQAEDRVLALTEALTMMVEEKCDYMRINHLGNPMTQHTIKVASKALATSSDLGASIRREIEREAIKRCAKLVEHYGYQIFPDQLSDTVDKLADELRRALLPPDQATEEAGDGKGRK